MGSRRHCFIGIGTMKLHLITILAVWSCAEWGRVDGSNYPPNMPNIPSFDPRGAQHNNAQEEAAPVMKESNKAMEVDTVIIRNMVVVMDTALLVDTDILMEAMATEVCVNTAEVTENMEDTEITDTNRIMVEVMAMDILLMEAMVMEEDTNHMAKDTEVDMEVTETTNSEAMVVTAVSNLEAMAVTVVTNMEVMVGMEVTDLEAMAVTAATSLEAMAVTVATNSEVMEATEVVMAT